MNVYDFDNTIYDGESTFDLFLFYLKKKPSLIRLLPTVVKAFSRYKKGKISINEMIENYIPLIESEGKKFADLKKDPVEFWDTHMDKIKPFYKEIQKEDDLIITASPDFTMEEICKRLGIKYLLSTTVNKETGKFERICLKDNKLKAFFEFYGDAEIENFYTDSPENDYPLIEKAQHAFIVKGDKITQVK
ncbi:MAG: haloacid dehalogenase-like hydrolase [Clostridia bacterium]|nr:haloacid dehalogenase-like hydrolase [Clostridia bacterium]MCQ2479882.1 haloacid dehalogenase-like hydrolase [Clostridia bacterium]